MVRRDLHLSDNRGEYSAQSNLLLGESPAVSAIDDLSIKDLFPEVIAFSSAMVDVLRLASKVSRSSSSVLILGESGTGKELIASAVHRLSERCHHNYIAINCSAIPEELLEAELFGHEKGAFTGADRKRVGHFGRANHGTIFLDEVGDMPARLQAKLLRVLQEKKYTPVGSNEVKEVDVRIVAATNVNLEMAVREQRFRLDLYYRLNVLPIVIPPLRERREDISHLLQHFLDLTNLSHRVSLPCWIDESAMCALRGYDWPGNVRQLQNVVERLVILKGGGRICFEDLPTDIIAGVAQEDVRRPIGESKKHIKSEPIPDWSPFSTHEAFEKKLLPEEGIHLSSFVEDLENKLILEALQRTQNNKNQAAKLLGLNRTTLVERIKKRKLLDGAQELALEKNTIFK